LASGSLPTKGKSEGKGRLPKEVFTPVGKGEERGGKILAPKGEYRRSSFAVGRGGGKKERAHKPEGKKRKGGVCASFRFWFGPIGEGRVGGEPADPGRRPTRGKKKRDTPAFSSSFRTKGGGGKDTAPRSEKGKRGEQSSPPHYGRRKLGPSRARQNLIKKKTHPTDLLTLDARGGRT